MTPAVTVVIPTYNAAAFIGDTLASVFAQTAPPAEVVVVDDGSTDGTADRVEAAALGAAVPVRVIRLATGSGGPAHPINVGVAASRTPLIALFDHDDLMLPDKLALQSASLAAVPDAVFSFGDYRRFTADRELGGLAAADRAEFALRGRPAGDFLRLPGPALAWMQLPRPGLIMSCSNLLFARSAWDRFGPFDTARSTISDYVFKARALAGGDAVFVPRPLFRKRCHTDNLFDKADGPGLRADILQVGLWGARVAGATAAEAGPADRRAAEAYLLDVAFRLQLARKPGAALRAMLQGVRLVGPTRRLTGGLARWPAAAVRYGLRTPPGGGQRVGFA